jgi:hypothetical protein
MAPPPFGCPASSLLERPLGFASPPRDGFAFIAAPVALARNYSQVAGPSLEGGQVATLRLHVASSCHVMASRYSPSAASVSPK